MENIINNEPVKEISYTDGLANFLDEDKKIKSWPAKKEKKQAVLLYLSTKFEKDRMYTEKEVNERINEWHTFRDFFLLRRGLIEEGLLNRTRDGSRYWKN